MHTCGEAMPSWLYVGTGHWPPALLLVWWLLYGQSPLHPLGPNYYNEPLTVDRKSEAQDPECHSWDVGWSQFVSGSSSRWGFTVLTAVDSGSCLCSSQPLLSRNGPSCPGSRLLPVTLSPTPEFSRPWNSNDFTSPASGCSRSWNTCKESSQGGLQFLSSEKVLKSSLLSESALTSCRQCSSVLAPCHLLMRTTNHDRPWVLILWCQSQRSIFHRDPSGPAERTALFWALSFTAHWRRCLLDPLSPHRT